MPTIYHYCDANALLSIVKNKKLWLSSTTKMNDVKEGSVVETALRYRLSRPMDKLTLEEIDPYIKVVKDEIYACCFSSEGDSTVQWMSYADSGKGFAIGFDTGRLLSQYPDSSSIETFESYFKDNTKKLRETNKIKLSPVIYFTDKNRSKIMQLISNLLKKIGATEDENELHYYTIAQTTAWFDSITKDAGFSHEVEYRLTHTPEGLTLAQMIDTSNYEPLRASDLDPLLWRASRYGLAPYYEFCFPPDAIKEILIGPRNPDHPNVSAQHLVKQFCVRNEIPHAHVQNSKSPYRG
ncbi:hypothetical protein HDG32_001347 [Paraburkholderia sp. CI2]|uniref:DUF2971 domain-containing protein n=1 Tax=Paraburkholderia sp. CI2 TaxID=2723093 RepID=UPI0016161E94|nr:DUF2971 domain-containing protein [Paraburkholderia sp. CI2]MBB5465243.1 hypothetical protein [Paraburkholderia sp. CI2]